MISISKSWDLEILINILMDQSIQMRILNLSLDKVRDNKFKTLLIQEGVLLKTIYNTKRVWKELIQIKTCLLLINSQTRDLIFRRWINNNWLQRSQWNLLLTTNTVAQLTKINTVKCRHWPKQTKSFRLIEIWSFLILVLMINLLFRGA